MRKLIVKLSAAAMIAAGAVGALQAGASAAPYPHADSGAAAAAVNGTDPVLSFSTTMISYTRLASPPARRRPETATSSPGRSPGTAPRTDCPLRSAPSPTPTARCCESAPWTTRWPMA